MSYQLSADRILAELAAECTRAEDAGFWILTSAAWRLQGHTEGDSTAEVMYWSRLSWTEVEA